MFDCFSSSSPCMPPHLQPSRLGGHHRFTSLIIIIITYSQETSSSPYTLPPPPSTSWRRVLLTRWCWSSPCWPPAAQAIDGWSVGCGPGSWRWTPSCPPTAQCWEERNQWKNTVDTLVSCMHVGSMHVMQLQTKHVQSMLDTKLSCARI